MNQPIDNIHEIVAMAWCDKTAFEDIQALTDLSEPQVIAIMRQHLRPSSFRLWRKRVSGRVAKHRKRQTSPNMRKRD
ncbi:TIGR03643 family protein [Marinomonas agarivorans]|nr:TIGR03643 family protein [Marinomonas agarivorans]